MAASVKTSFTPGTMKTIVIEPKSLSQPVPKQTASNITTVCLQKVFTYIHAQDYALCQSVCKRWKKESAFLLKNRDFCLAYAQGFFRLLWIEYFNLPPTRVVMVRDGGEKFKDSEIRSPIPRTASFQSLVQMDGKLLYFFQGNPRVKLAYQNNEFAAQYFYFSNFEKCLTRLVNEQHTRSGDEPLDAGVERFVGFMQEVAKLRGDKKRRFEPINEVFESFELSPLTVSQPPKGCCVIL